MKIRKGGSVAKQGEGAKQGALEKYGSCGLPHLRQPRKKYSCLGEPGGLCDVRDLRRPQGPLAGPNNVCCIRQLIDCARESMMLWSLGWARVSTILGTLEVVHNHMLLNLPAFQACLAS